MPEQDNNEEATVVRRLVVNLNAKSDAALNDLSARLEMNKTTVVNRALQLYKIISDVQQTGGEITFDLGGERTRLVVLDA